MARRIGTYSATRTSRLISAFKGEHNVTLPSILDEGMLVGLSAGILPLVLAVGIASADDPATPKPPDVKDTAKDSAKDAEQDAKDAAGDARRNAKNAVDDGGDRTDEARDAAKDRAEDGDKDGKSPADRDRDDDSSREDRGDARDARERS